MDKKRYIIKSKLVTIAAAQAADTVSSSDFEPDKDYKNIKAVRAYFASAITGAGATFVYLGLQNSKGDIIEFSHSDGWIPSTAVPMKDRWIEINQYNDGSMIKCRAKNPVLAAGSYQILFEFLLEDELQIVGTN